MANENRLLLNITLIIVVLGLVSYAVYTHYSNPWDFELKVCEQWDPSSLDDYVNSYYCYLTDCTEVNTWEPTMEKTCVCPRNNQTVHYYCSKQKDIYGLRDESRFKVTPAAEEIAMNRTGINITKMIQENGGG